MITGLDSIIQWNLQSLKTKFSELKLIINEYLPICVCVQETLAHINNINNISGYNICHSNPVRDDGHERGASIIINKNINFSRIPLITNLQAVAIKIHLTKSYTICSIYLPHVDLLRQDLEDLFDQLGPHSLILGDFNARHQMWGDHTANARGFMIEELISDRDLILLNDGTPTHYQIQTDSYSNIDLSITSSDCYTDFEYARLESLHGSDHYPIRIKLQNTTEMSSRPVRFNLKKADWSTFKTLTEFNGDIESLTIDENVERIEELITAAASGSIPLTSGRVSKPPLPWWSEDIANCRQWRKRAERRLKRNFSIINKISYNRAKAKCTYLCNEARRESWRHFLSSINQYTSMNKIWKKVMKISGKFSQTPTPILEVDDRIIQHPNEVAEILANSFSNVSNNRNYSPEFLRHKIQEEQRRINFENADHLDYNHDITQEEYETHLSQTQDTSPGIDNITYSMLKHVSPSLTKSIISLYNKIYKQSYYPERWRTAIIVPIPKPGKDPKIPTNYRPISLTCCLSKLLEKIINVRTMTYLERNHNIMKHQSGFRANRSTTDNLIQFENFVLTSMSRRNHALAVFFDISKAYDMAWRYKVISQLKQFGLKGLLPKFVQSFLYNRRIVVRVGSTISTPKEISEGILQGSVLSCTCFLIAINEIAKNIGPSIGYSLYVDDFAIYSSGAVPHMVERRLQTAIHALQRWSQSCGLNFSAEKTVSMHICRKQNCPKINPNLTLNGTSIQTMESYRYLGVILDSSFSWRPHIKELKIKCTRVLDLLKHLSHKTWGADRTSLLRLYTALLKPKIEYGCEAYSSCKPYLIKRVEAVQNQAIRTATGAFRSSPIISISAESGIKPLKFSFDQKLINYTLRIRADPTHPVNDILDETPTDPENPYIQRSFRSRSQTTMLEYGINFENVSTESMEIPRWLSKIQVCQELHDVRKNDYNEIQLRAIFRDHILKHQPPIMYTDGSKRSEGVGCAAVDDQAVFAKKLSPLASVYTAELLAIQEAVTQLSLRNSVSAVIVTDSKSAIQGLKNTNSKNPLIRNIRNKSLHFENKLTLCWVPSHIGIHLNEKADKEANQIALKTTIDHETIPKSDMKVHIKQAVKHKWRDKWQNTTRNKYREITDSINPLVCATSSNRQWERTLARLRLGHSMLTHGFLMNRENAGPPMCHECGSPLTIKHLLTECMNFNQDRVLCFNQTYTDLATILNRRDNTFGGPLYNYIIRTNSYNSL